MDGDDNDLAVLVVDLLQRWLRQCQYRDVEPIRQQHTNDIAVVTSLHLPDPLPIPMAIPDTSARRSEVSRDSNAALRSSVRRDTATKLVRCDVFALPRLAVTVLGPSPEPLGPASARSQ